MDMTYDFDFSLMLSHFIYIILTSYYVTLKFVIRLFSNKPFNDGFARWPIENLVKSFSGTVSLGNPGEISEVDSVSYCKQITPKVNKLLTSFEIHDTNTKYIFQDLKGPLQLTINLRMEKRTKAQLSTQSYLQSLSKLWDMIAVWDHEN